MKLARTAKTRFAKNKFKELAIKCKKECFAVQQLDAIKLSNAKNPTVFYKCVNKKLGKKSNNNIKLKSKNTNNLLSNADSCEEFGNFFESVFTTDDKKLPKELPNTNLNSELDDIIFNEECILKVIKNLSNSKSCGPDNVSNFFIK